MPMQWIELPCQAQDSLEWSQELEIARSFQGEQEKIIWKLDIGLENSMYPLDCELTFQAASLAMRRFREHVWPLFQKETKYICLYQGMAPKTMILADMLANYFQMLSYQLPDEANLLLLFDLCAMKSLLSALQIISKERFSHFTTALRGMQLPIEGLIWDEKGLQWQSLATNAGFVFPKELTFDFTLPKNVKVIFESFLSEEWEELDLLYVVKDSLKPQTARKLQGFSAAGGEVVEILKDDIQKTDSG